MLPCFVLTQRPRAVLVGIERDTSHRAPPCGIDCSFFTGSVHHYRQSRRAFITSQHLTPSGCAEIRTVSPESLQIQ